MFFLTILTPIPTIWLYLTWLALTEVGIIGAALSVHPLVIISVLKALLVASLIGLSTVPIRPDQHLGRYPPKHPLGYQVARTHPHRLVQPERDTLNDVYKLT